jgi:hypothetical protein
LSPPDLIQPIQGSKRSGVPGRPHALLAGSSLQLAGPAGHSAIRRSAQCAPGSGLRERGEREDAPGGASDRPRAKLDGAHERLTKPDKAAMRPGGMHRQEGPAGQRGLLFKGPDAAGRPPGFIPPGEGRRGGSASANASEREGPAGQGLSGGGRCSVTSSYHGAVRRSYSPPARRAGASVARSACYALTRLPRLARPAPLARRRGAWLGAQMHPALYPAKPGVEATGHSR